VDMLVVDKTGTLTEGNHDWSQICDAGVRRSPLLRLALLERGSEHTLAAAIVAGAGERNVRWPRENFQSLTGRGIKGTVDPNRRLGTATCSTNCTSPRRVARKPSACAPMPNGDVRCLGVSS